MKILAGLLLAALVFALAMRAGAHGISYIKPRWTHKTCLTNNCIAETLNSLSPERSTAAKLTTWKNVTYVWYQE